MKIQKIFLIITLSIFLLESVYFFFGIQPYLDMFAAYSKKITVSFWAMPSVPLLCAVGLYFFIQYVNKKQRVGEKIVLLWPVTISIFIFSFLLFYFLTFWGAYVAFQVSV